MVSKALYWVCETWEKQNIFLLSPEYPCKGQATILNFEQIVYTSLSPDDPGESFQASRSIRKQEQQHDNCTKSQGK